MIRFKTEIEISCDGDYHNCERQEVECVKGFVTLHEHEDIETGAVQTSADAEYTLPNGWTSAPMGFLTHKTRCVFCTANAQLRVEKTRHENLRKKRELEGKASL